MKTAKVPFDIAAECSARPAARERLDAFHGTNMAPSPSGLIGDNYSCRSATITFAGPSRPDGPVRVFGSKSPGLAPVLPEPAWCATSRSGC